MTVAAATGVREEGGLLSAARFFFFRRRLPLLAMCSVIAGLLAAGSHEQYRFALACIPEAFGLRQHSRLRFSRKLRASARVQRNAHRLQGVCRARAVLEHHPPPTAP